MIVVYHSDNKILEIIDQTGQKLDITFGKTIAEVLFNLASQFPCEKLIWCHNLLRENIDLEEIDALFHHDKMMYSYACGSLNYFNSSIGYVENTPFIKVNKKVTYPTWQMSSSIGVIHASVLNLLRGKIKPDADLDYFLCSVAKLCMRIGLLCYSEPGLLKSNSEVILTQSGMSNLFRFVKQHYRTRWVFLLLLNLFLYERRVPLLAFLQSFFYKKRDNAKIDLKSIEVQSKRKVVEKGTVDVIIPTIGRKEYLYDVLKDFAKQTILPNKIIIVEQNPDPAGKSELDYIESENWPYVIQHFFIQQAGACNARNLALSQVESEWVFFADDDIRFEDNFIKKAMETIRKYGANAVSMSCLQKNEIEKNDMVFQWAAFGSGCSFVASEFLKSCEFNTGYEFGFGEDSDFGMQIRNLGLDVLYIPEPTILHLKAPIGGFRTKPVRKWDNELIKPHPTPTVMLYTILHNTPEQISLYKTIFIINYYKYWKIKNPIKYYNIIQRHWEQSVFWANKLNQK